MTKPYNLKLDHQLVSLTLRAEREKLIKFSERLGKSPQTQPYQKAVHAAVGILFQVEIKALFAQEVEA